MRRILFTTFGSYGDLFPYLAIGSELKARGHEVTIGTSPSFRSKVEEAGLLFRRCGRMSLSRTRSCWPTCSMRAEAANASCVWSRRWCGNRTRTRS